MINEVSPRLQSSLETRFDLGGEIGRRVRAVIEQWILPAPFANPYMLDMFRAQRDEPDRARMAWENEFAGKYLTHAAQIYRLCPDPKLRRHLDWFVDELAALQQPDGYMGPWPPGLRFNEAAAARHLWDVWGHYHTMLGSLMWHGATANEPALGLAVRIADMCCDVFLGERDRLLAVGSPHTNMAIIHALCLLYRIKRDERHLQLARQIAADFEKPPAGDYVRNALDGRDFFECPQPRWESLHAIQGVAELHLLTGEEAYRQAFERTWWSIVRTDRHNNGGFSSGERAWGDPYHMGAIETCCTVAWMALSVDMLRLSGDSRVADELELSLFNSGLGLMSPSGRWVTYNTPMQGRRIASPNDATSFQARHGRAELNCCSVNGPRALGMTCAWAVMQRADGLALNYYGPGAIDVPLGSGDRVRITQDTEYPLEAVSRIGIGVERPTSFLLALRIPHWSTQTKVAVNGAAIESVRPGRYLEIERTWADGDTLDVIFDFDLHYWAWREACEARPLVADWHLFGPGTTLDESGQDEADEALLSAVTGAVPGQLRIGDDAFDADVRRSDGGWLDFRRIFKRSRSTLRDAGNCEGGELVYALTQLHCDQEEQRVLEFGADWWYSVYLNGRRLAAGHHGDENEKGARQNRVALPLKAGPNILAVRVSGGGDGWHLTAALGRPYGVPAHLASIYRGPLLLTYDPRLNAPDLDGEHLPALDHDTVRTRRIQGDHWPAPWLLVESAAADGTPLRLCDFASAGAAGHAYRTWLAVLNTRTTAFSEANPLRSSR